MSRGDVPQPESVPALASSRPGSVRPVLVIRWCAVVGWTAFLLSLGLLVCQHRAGVLHPVVAPFLLPLMTTLATSTVGTAWGLWQPFRRGQRRATAVWGLVCLAPLAFWLGLSVYALRAMAVPQALPKNIFSDIVNTGGATVMEGLVPWMYPHRLESQRLVMFFDDRVSDPRKDLEAMDRHVAELEAATGQPLRERIHWVRGEVFGLRKMALRGLSLGSSQSPADWTTAGDPDGVSLDRHELAHGVAHQLQPPDADPPTFLIEGWAEAHSGVSRKRRAEWAIQSRDLWRERTGAGPTSSYISELTGPEWHHRIAGPVYNVGGAFAQFVLAKHGTEKFLRWYFACRCGTVADECLAQLGVELTSLEAEFWPEMERLAETRPTED